MVQLTTVRRPPARGPVVAPPPAQLLVPRRCTHLRDGLALAGLGAIGYGAAPLTGHPLWDLPALVIGVGTGAGVAATGSRRKLRNELHDRLVEALAPYVGGRAPDRRTVRVRSWSRGWPGLPGRVEVRYAPGVPDADPQWKAGLLGAVAGRLLSSYNICRHDRRRCRLTLQHQPGTDDANPSMTPERARAERTVTELLGPTAKVTAVEVEDDQLRRIAVEHQAGTKLAASGYRTRIERTVSAVLPGRWRARWDMEGDRVVFEVRPSFPSTIWLPPVQVDPAEDVLATYDDVAIPYGVDEDGHELVWRPALDPNLMVVGAPGTGKTALEHGILAGVTRYGWPAWVADGKSIEFLGYRDWPNVQVVATTVQEQVAVIERAWELMEHRYQLIVTGRASETDFEPLMVFLDEFADFRANLLDWYATVKVKGDPTRPPVLAKAASIARKGRSSRVHFLIATQRPDASFFESDQRDNFRARISMGRLSPQGAMMMWQDPSTGTTVPRACRGRATTINDDNRAVEIQTYYIPDPRRVRDGEEEKLRRLETLRPEVSRHERLLIIAPETVQDLDSADGAVLAPTYHDYATAAWAPATERPDLDPLARATASPADARELASPMSLFNIRRAAPAPITATPADELRPRLSVVPALAPDPDTDPPDDVAPDVDPSFTGYGPPFDVPADRATVGDLVLVDPATDRWAVIDEEPGEDPADPTSIAVCWRDDIDEAGLLSLPDGERLTIRRPLEED